MLPLEVNKRNTEFKNHVGSVDLFPTRIHKFKLNNKLIDSTYKKIKKQNDKWITTEVPFRGTSIKYARSRYIDILKNPVFKSLHKKVLKLATQVCPVAQNIGKWNIVGAWANCQKKGDTGFGFHNHSDSFMTCVLYIKGQNMELGFKDDIRGASPIDLTSNACFDIYVTHSWHPPVLMNVNIGDLMVFPSYQMHSPNENEADEDRISIAYNLFPNRDNSKIRLPWSMDLKL